MLFQIRLSPFQPSVVQWLRHVIFSMNVRGLSFIEYIILFIFYIVHFYFLPFITSLFIYFLYYFINYYIISPRNIFLQTM